MKAIISSTFRYVFGTESGIINVLLTLMAADYITGICVAIYMKRISSAVGFKGILKKISIITLVVMAHACGVYLFHDDNTLRNTTAMFYASNEVISIFENISHMDIPLPDVLIKVKSYFSSDNKPKK